MARVANGPGRELAGAAARVAIAKVNPAAVVSTGFCGGLNPALATGEVFVASTVLGRGAQRWEACRPGTRAPHHVGVLATVDVVATTAAAKAVLRQRGADAVDMEAEAVAEAARDAGLPFYAVRVVLDTAEHELILDFNRARDSAGRFSRLGLVGAALARPVRGLPELAWLARNTRAAARTLGDFLAHCRF